MKLPDFNITQEQYMKIAKGDFRAPFFVFTPLAILQFAASLFIFHKNLLFAAGLVVAGFFVWGFFEYGLHRFSFHINPKNGLLRFFTCGFHQLHHKVPQSKEFIVAPIYFAVWGQFLIVCLGFLTLRDWGNASAVGAGVALGYMYYEWVHYICHHKNPQSHFYKRLKELHLQHHFKNPKKGFGVSYPFWDYLFGTFAKPVSEIKSHSEITAKPL